MKKKLIIAAMILTATGAVTASARAANKAEQLGIYGGYKEMEATAYNDKGLCYDETVPVEGITCAAAKQYIGKTFVIYDENWTLIGIYECHDTGGDYRIQNGTVVDIYTENAAICNEFGRQKVHVQIVDAEG